MEAEGAPAQLLTEALPLAFGATSASGFFICFGNCYRDFLGVSGLDFYNHLFAFRFAFVLHRVASFLAPSASVLGAFALPTLTE